MATSMTRRLKRMQEREANKLFKRIQKETMEEIMKQPLEQRKDLLALYEHMTEERKELLKAKEQDNG